MPACAPAPPAPPAAPPTLLAETIARLRGAGAGGELTLRADSGFYNAKVAQTCRERGVRFSIMRRGNPPVQQLLRKRL